MNKQTTYGILAVIIVIIAAGAVLAFMPKKQAPEASSVATSTPVSEVISGVSLKETYRNQEFGFEVDYPEGFIPDETHRYERLENQPLLGVAFKMPASYGRGTNLSSDSYIAFERQDDGENKTCIASDFLTPDAKQSSGWETISGRTYSYFSTLGAGAGNLYDETVYTTNIDDTSCLIARLFLHSSNIGILRETNPDVKEYDKDALSRIFEAMIESVRFIDPLESWPAIEAVRPSKAKIGSVIELVGYNLSGFEGDLDAWIVDSSGDTAYLPPSENLYPEKYKEILPGKEIIRVRLDKELCRANVSYKGGDCPSFMALRPGTYKIYTDPWGKKSNSVSIEITN